MLPKLFGQHAQHNITSQVSIGIVDIAQMVDTLGEAIRALA